MKSRVIIVGRPNVGKSTLFNRLVGRRKSLVHNVSGVTRDRIYQKVEWTEGGQRYEFDLVDTGGLGEGIFSKEIASQVADALGEATLALVVFDRQTGLTEEDRQMFQLVRKTGLPVIGVANKTDDPDHLGDTNEFYELGLEDVIPVSAEHDVGIVELREKISAHLSPVALDSKSEELEAEEKPPRIAIVGIPNAGKSTLVNAFLSRNRMVTSSIAGTTVDAIDSVVEISGRKYQIIDTAGIRKKAKTQRGVEVLSIVQAKKALERADLAILLIDGTKGSFDQDEKIASLIEDAGCGTVIAVNKWDLQKGKYSEKQASEYIRSMMPFLGYAPIVFVSALKRKGLKNLGKLFEEILSQRKTKIATPELTEWVRREAQIHNPKNARFFLCHQIGQHPPSFAFHVSDPKKIHFSLRRHFVNGLRKGWGYMGNPIRLKFVQRESRFK